MITSTINVPLNGSVSTLNVTLGKHPVFVFGSLFEPCMLDNFEDQEAKIGPILRLGPGCSKAD